ncbi:MAG: septal ring lytic transglycosylase RlpA family protein [Acidobacteriota bacterium]
MNTVRERNSRMYASRSCERRSNVTHSIPIVFIACIFFVVAAGCSKHKTVHAPQPLKPARIGKTEKGLASWYGIPYHGRRAASGEVFDMEQLTAAHRTLPFQTWVMVTNLDNGKKVDVRITDRGPFVDNRVIDLSKAAAREIDMLGPGTARVKLKVIKPPKNFAKNIEVKVDPVQPVRVTPSVDLPLIDPLPAPPSSTEAVVQPPPSSATPSSSVPSRNSTQATYSVQAGAFSSQANAEALRDRIQKNLLNLDQDRAVVRVERRTGPSGAPLWFVLVGDHLSREAANVLALSVKEISGDAVVVTNR